MLSKRLVFPVSVFFAVIMSFAGVGPFQTAGALAASSFNVTLQGQSSLTVGQSGTFSVSAVNNGGSVSGGIIDVEIYNAGNQRVYQQFLSGQNFNTGQQVNGSVSWTPSTAGTYRAKVGIFTSDWSNLLAWNDNAMQISVEAPAASVAPKFSATGSVTAGSFTLGSQEQLSANVQDSGSISNVTVMLEVANAAGQNVYQKLFYGQNFSSGQTQRYSAQWTPTVAGDYAMNVGVFAPNWSSLLGWMGGVGKMSITVPQASPVSTSNTVSTTNATSANIGNLKLYVDPNSEAEQAMKSDPADAAKLNVLASEPSGVWLGGWDANIYQDVKSTVDAASAQGAVPVLVAYNIPDRDCGGYSAGGAQTPDAYRSWIQSFANGIGSRNAIVILEPDGLANIDCMSVADQATRISLLSTAVSVLKGLGNTQVYLDAGNPNWIPAATMATRLESANIASADGFALNVSNFYSTSQNEQYGNALSSLLGGKHYVIDTSRNGNGAPAGGAWCNPSGMAIGAFPTSNTGDSLVNDFLWIKPPGESDGSCNGGPAAGTFWTSYAVGLVTNAGL